MNSSERLRKRPFAILSAYPCPMLKWNRLNGEMNCVELKMKRIVRPIVKAVIPARQRPRLKQLIRKVSHFGWQFKCPICGSHLRSLRPFGLKIPVLTEKKVIGGGYRLNVQCPVCYSTDRERLLYLYLLKKTNLFAEQVKLLHVAPESGLSAILNKQSNVDYLTADLMSETVMVKMDITEINYPDNSFDAIICNHVLEHIPDDGKAMRELCRVLKPGGWGILQVPISLSLNKTFEDFSVTTPSEKENMFGQADHVRIYAADYPDRLKEAGFQVDLFKWWLDEEFSCANNKFRLLRDESVFLVTKPQ